MKNMFHPKSKKGKRPIKEKNVTLSSTDLEGCHFGSEHDECQQSFVTYQRQQQVSTISRSREKH